MLKKQSKNQSEVFSEFKALDHRNFHAVIRFYERHKNEVFDLRFHEAFILQLHYTNALYEIGHYEKHLQQADNIIELSILNNIQYYQGEDVYIKTLFQKSQSLYALEAYTEAIHLLKELIKISPNQKTYGKALKRCLIQSKATYLQHLQASGIVAFLVSFGIVIINVLLIENFYSEYQTLFVRLYTIGFLLGSILLGAGLLIQRFLIHNEVRRFQKMAQRRKSLAEQQLERTNEE